MDNCIFCKIIKGEIPSKKVFEDENVIAINDINPQAPVHSLIMPKKHIEDIMGVNKEDSDILYSITKAAQKIAADNNIEEKGFRLINNCGKDGGQTVMHLHFHLLGGRELGEKLN